MTLEITPEEQALQESTDNMRWEDAKPLWDAASAEFANSAEGSANVFQNAAEVDVESTWATVEYSKARKEWRPC